LNRKKGFILQLFVWLGAYLRLFWRLGTPKERILYELLGIKNVSYRSMKNAD